MGPRAGALHHRQDGRPQVPRGAREEEAERCYALSAPRSLLGAPPAERDPPRLAPVSPRQGPPHGIQGQAGLRRLPYPCAPTCACSTATGSTRTAPTSTTRSSASTRCTRPSAAMLASTGSLTRSTSTASAVVL